MRTFLRQLLLIIPMLAVAQVSLAQNSSSDHQLIRRLAVFPFSVPKDLNAAESRLLVVRAMIAILPEVGSKMESSYETEFLSPNFVISRLLVHLPPLTSAVCTSLGDIHAPEAQYARPVACDVFDPPPVAPIHGPLVRPSNGGAK